MNYTVGCRTDLIITTSILSHKMGHRQTSKHSGCSVEGQGVPEAIAATRAFNL